MSERNKKGSFFRRFAWLILAGFALATPVVFFGAGKAVGSNSNKVEDWLPAGFKETGELGWFRERFVGDQFVIVSWDGCQLGDRRQRDGSRDDPRIEQLALMLVPEETGESSADSANEAMDRKVTPYGRYFKSVMTARRLLDQLTAEPNGVPYDKAVARLTGSLIGSDARQTCLIVTLSDAAISDFKGAIARGNTRLIGRKPQGALFDALQECGVDIETVHLGGPPVDNVAIDEEGERTLIRLAGLSGLLGLGLAYFSLRSIKLTAIVFGCGVLSAAAALASIWFTGEKTDAVVLSMPALVYVLFIPPLPVQRQGTTSVIRRSVTESKIEASYDELLSSGYLRIDPVDQAELWRVSIRVAAFQDVDYGRFSERLRQDVEPLLEAFRLRRKILANIAAARQGNSYVGATVLWWSQGNALAEQVSSGPRQDALATTLRTLLQRDRVRLVERDQDVAEVTLTQLDQLGQFDSLVLAGLVSDADVHVIRDVIPSLVCLREPDETIVDGASVQVVPLADDTSISTVYTGVVPIVYKAQRALLDRLIQSTFWSFVTILPLLMFVSRGVAAGVVAMLPNVLPVLVIFGGMGWLGLPIDIGSMMSASIALGVGVDDTIHYLTWFREDLNRTGNRQQAILGAYQRCATPTLQAALISGLGLSVFAFSTFTPTQQFGYLMLTILLAGVVAELVMLPAILAGPLGWAFQPANSKSKDPKLPGVLLRPTKIRVSKTGLQIPQ